MTARTRPLSILVLTPEYPPIGGGAGPVAQCASRELVARGHRVDVVTMRFGELPARLEESDGKLRVFRVTCLRGSQHMSSFHELLTFVVSAFFTALRLHRAQRYDVVHAHFFFPSGVVACLLKLCLGIPFVATAHGSDVPGYNPDRFSALHRLFEIPWSLVVRQAALVTSPSRFLAGLIERSLRGSQRIEIVPNGIAPDWIQPGEKTRSILLVSRLFERKGAQYLIEALRGTRLGYEVHIVGDGPYLPRLEELARGIEDPVTFHGWIDNDSPKLADLYRRASIFVFPSMSENFPLCLLESMLAGAAIVSSDLEACREVLGSAARFAPVGDVGALRGLLVDLISDPGAIEELGTEARERACDRFSWSRVGALYEQLLAETIHGRADS